MARRVYEELRRIIENEGGSMVYQKSGYGAGGAWIASLDGSRKVFKSNTRGFPLLDRLYVPAKQNPKHWQDYTTKLVDDGASKFKKMIKG